VAAVIAELEVEMTEAAGRLEFERAAVLRDQVEALRSGDFRRMGKAGGGKGAGKRGRYGRSRKR
jgi:excinuclease ABC subunit B